MYIPRFTPTSPNNQDTSSSLNVPSQIKEFSLPDPASSPGIDRSLPPRSFIREGAGLEFDRVTFFSDAVFAIAMTLLVVSLTVPELTRDEDLPREMLRALSDRQPDILSFFIGFAMLGFYWTGHHHFFSTLRAVSRSFIRVNLVYLAIVAFLPFPTALIGKYEDNPVSFVLFALSIAAISGLEVVLFIVATDQQLTMVAIPPRVRRYGIVAQAAPVALFLLSIPLAFWSTSAALYSWLLTFPLGAALNHLGPADANRYL